MKKFINICELVYPVGSVYLSTDKTSPAEKFGGTWVAITDKYLKLVSDGAGVTGGSNTHYHLYGFQYIPFNGIAIGSDASMLRALSFNGLGIEHNNTNSFPDGTQYTCNVDPNIVTNPNGRTYQGKVNAAIRLEQSSGNYTANIQQKVADTSPVSNEPAHYTVYGWVRVS